MGGKRKKKKWIIASQCGTKKSEGGLMAERSPSHTEKSRKGIRKKTLRERVSVKRGATADLGIQESGQGRQGQIGVMEGHEKKESVPDMGDG